MTRFLPAGLCLSLATLIPAAATAQLNRATIERGKRATALVEVSAGKERASGSAFCIDRSGLFITNAHVVDLGEEGQRAFRLVLDIGLETERGAEARVLKQDDRLDLALLKVDADPALVPLELGQDGDLLELTRVFAFGYPFGHEVAVGKAKYPDVTVLASRVTSLRRNGGRLQAVQFDNQLNPGNSGGPVLDGSGKLIGVARATVTGAAVNLAVPVSRLADFLAAPKLVFEPSPVKWLDREWPVPWTVRVQPARPGAELPGDLAVTVTVPSPVGEPCASEAKSLGGGTFKAIVTPMPRPRERTVKFNVENGPASFLYAELKFRDDVIMAGESRFALGVLRTLFGGRSPRDSVLNGLGGLGPFGLDMPGKDAGRRKKVSVELGQARSIGVTPVRWPDFQAIRVVVDARQGSRVVATIHRRVVLDGPHSEHEDYGPQLTIRMPRPLPPSPFPDRVFNDDDQLTLGGTLHVDGVPSGAGKDIHPPRVAIGPARFSEAAEAGSAGPLVLTLDARIDDVVAGGGGRYLLLLMKEARKVAVFDLNEAAVTATIPLPSPDALVAAGARKALIAFPGENLIRRWDLDAKQPDGDDRELPFKKGACRLDALAMGGDSSGPALVVWTASVGQGSRRQAWSFIDLESLKVPTPGLIAEVGHGGANSISPAGGSFELGGMGMFVNDEPTHIRASADGSVFAMWHTSSIPTGFLTLEARGKALISIYQHDTFDHLAPGPDGRAVFSGQAGRLDVDGRSLDHPRSKAAKSLMVTIPSADPAYYLELGGLAHGYQNPGAPAPPGPVTAGIHSAGDGRRLLTVHGLDEMADALAYHDQAGNVARFRGDFNIDKRFHLVPAAGLLITIPMTNDRLVLRRLDLAEALDRVGGDYLVVASPVGVVATAARGFEHQVLVKSKRGGVTCKLVRGPDGLVVTADGKVTWPVPKELGGDDATAEIAIKDSSGQGRTHRLQVRVNPGE